ncbi:hypothetical protein HDF26_000963 [Pedobacter cryoconitis]|uniref:hypothetical protein n=1 Tax=Pedobacter cryoconitis TaxID=188932 RepID=UPI00161B0B32|nr:hypothetical protein [Pedobacter cryoconitis]MBB6270536.1 hypothetical protein [Pedobacter cryoconitis]
MENDSTLEKIIFEIEHTESQTIEKKSEYETFELWRDPVLQSNLSGNIGILFIRSILKKLNIDEHRVFQWRLEHKYWQYQVLNYYIPGCMAQTISLSKLLNEPDGVQKINELCEAGFFIKSALGDSSGRDNNFDRTSELNEIINFYHKKHDHDEEWILQKRLNFKKEFRIHTFQKDLIPGLTSITEGQDLSGSYPAEEFVKMILKKLPNAIMNGTLMGWDIGLTDKNEHYVIETNITGFHPKSNRGFQTSGYFGDPDYGTIMSAWLNNYFRNEYNVSIDSVENDLSLSDKFYTDFIFYSSIFNDEQLHILDKGTKDINNSAIIYLGDHTDSRLLMVVNYICLANFAKTSYLIVSEKNFTTISNIFKGNKLIKILAEHTLFTDEQYKLIKHLSYERRKKICHYHTLRLIKENDCFTI